MSYESARDVKDMDDSHLINYMRMYFDAIQIAIGHGDNVITGNVRDGILSYARNNTSQVIQKTVSALEELARRGVRHYRIEEAFKCMEKSLQSQGGSNE